MLLFHHPVSAAASFPSLPETCSTYKNPPSPYHPISSSFLPPWLTPLLQNSVAKPCRAASSATNRPPIWSGTYPVHNEDPQLTFNLLGILVVARQIHSKGYQCPFVKCSFTGLPAALYLHLIGHITITAQPLPISHSPSDSAESSTFGCSTPSQGNYRVGLATPFSQLPGEPPSKKRRIEPPSSPTPDTTSSNPKTIPMERELKLQENQRHSDLRYCDLIDMANYKSVFRKAMRKAVNKSILCFSCCGCMTFHHPVERHCDSEALQDIWIGIPYLIFCIPALQRVVFGLLGKHNYHTVVQNIDSFVLWLFKASPLMALPTRATPNLFDLLIAFASSVPELTEIDWVDTLAEANKRMADL
ncbi:hypothetical protein DEU56DRAFT_917497 [Suillus clintonianus]|uniref:uncharacterized protein n=1 Tax=Suillus clintonianus TaxID=1904413 RepID=UPI001B8717DB|nr:uncharacterized protein DEU56DRAFT_917497 [Suillus clintonianus]KAG2123262.1 hypothetical protein DEU56DRAFT_917497 [Suillus clintonianus]